MAVTKIPSEQVEEPILRSSPIVSRKNLSSDIPRSSPVMTRRSPTTVDSQAKIIGITEPLPKPNIVITSEESNQRQQVSTLCVCVCMYVRVCICVCLRVCIDCTVQ